MSTTRLDIRRLEGTEAWGSGDLAALVRLHDWSTTTLGPIEHWPKSLHTTVAIMLRSPVAMVLMWGPDGVLIYNEGYARIAGERHPGVLGQPALQAWPEAAALNREVLQTCLTGKSLSLRRQRLLLNRSGAPEEVFLDLDYSPVVDESAVPAGVLAVVTEITQQIQGERALADREQRLRLAIGAGRLGAWEIDIASMRLEASELLNAALGLPHGGTLKYEALIQAVHADDRPLHQAAMANTIATGAELDIEHRLIGFDGRIRWFHVRAQLLRDEHSGQPRRLIGLSQDVTERREAEEALKASEAELRLIADALPVLIVYLGRDLVYRFANRASEDWFGLPPEQVIGSHITERLDPAVLAMRMPFIERVLAGERLTFETPWIVSDGGVRDAETLYTPKLAADGSVDGFYAFVTDLSERKATANRESFLLALNDSLRDLSDEGSLLLEAARALGEKLGAARVGFAEIEPGEQEIRLANVWREGRVRALAGRKHIARFVPQIVLDLCAGRSIVIDDVAADPRMAGDAAQSFAAMQVASIQAVPIMRQARLAAFLFVHQNRPRHWSNADIDLARTVAERAWLAVERARAEQALRELNATLEQRVNERTLALRDAEEALRQAQKMEAIGQLTGGIAHDLNNMLQGILGPLELLPRFIASGRTGDSDRFIQSAISSAQRAAALTHRLLAFARRQSLDVKPIDVNRLVLSMEDLMQRTLGRDTRLVLALEPETWPALTDANQLESALLNLTINARDAMPEGGRLSVESWNQSVYANSPEAGNGLAPGDYVCLAVRDTGVGMSAEVLAKAFDPFFTTKPIGQGSGLGLSMVWGFAKQSGGHVRIDSRAEAGTVVRLYLPRYVGAEPEPSSEAGTLRPDGNGECVLIVEDDPGVRMLVTNIIEELGYVAVATTEAEEALATLESDLHIDLLLTDVGLPGMGGRELAAAARQLRPALKVLFMTGYARDAVLRSGFLEAGMDMLTKPFTLDALAAKVRTMIAK